MNTKEAIEFLTYEKGYFINDSYGKKHCRELNEIIELLQRGKKYEEMWGELRIMDKVGCNPEVIIKELELMKIE